MMEHGMMYNPFFIVETIYSIFVVISVLIIFFKTREMYKLTDHKGLKYFGFTFLFLAVAHISKFFFRFFFKSVFFTNFFRPGRLPFIFGGIVFTYASVMAGLILIYSLIWKKIKLDERVILVLFNILAFFVTFFDYISGNPFIHIGIIAILFVITIIVSFLKYSKARKTHTFFLAYISILLIWILELVSIEIPRFMFELRLIIALISAGLYFAILWRVLKKT